MKPREQKINRVSIRIMDEEYLIRGAADTPYIEKVAAYVDTKMKQFTQKNPYLSPKKAAVLTAVNIADELFHLQEDYETLVQLLEEVKKDV